MAAMIADLDGSTFYWGTNAFVPGAYDHLRKFYDNGNQLVFVTQRDAEWERVSPVESYLKSLFPDCIVLFGISSPRILINDAGAVAINHPKNAAWEYEF